MTPGLELSTNLREVRVEAFLLKAPSRIFTVKTLLRHYAKQIIVSRREIGMLNYKDL